MNQDDEWDDAAREDLRANLRSRMLGEVRLARSDDEEILNTCREVYIDEDCPEDEVDECMAFAAKELVRLRSQLEKEQFAWPDETDCDRLDCVEDDLCKRGILLWQASPCCDTCSSSELPDRVDVIERRHNGFRDRLRGYAFFIDQNLPEMLSESTELSVYLAYGWFTPDGAQVAPEEYEKNALGIAREVCECLRDAGFTVDWNGDLNRKIGVALNWQRRTALR